MSQILLRVNNLNIEDGVYGKLNHFSLTLRSYQVLGLEGLNRSGKFAFVQALIGNIEISWTQNSIYLKNRKINNLADLQKDIEFLDFNIPLNMDWTVYEFLYLGRVGWFITRQQKVEMIKRAKEDCHKFGFRININKKICDLNNMEYRAVRLMKAARSERDIIVVDDTGYALTNYDLNQYADLLEKTAQMGKGIIILFHKNGIIGRLCSEYIIMRRGRAVKKCTRNPITQEDDQAFVLGETFQKQIESIESYERHIQHQNRIIYKVSDVIVEGKIRNYQFSEGEIFAYIPENEKNADDFFNTISGRKAQRSASYFLDGKQLTGFNMKTFIDNRIVSVRISDLEEESFNKMTVRDNLMIPFKKNISMVSFFKYGKQMGNVLCDEVPYESFGPNKIVGKETINRQIIILMSRWLVYKPKVLVIEHPFKGCDTYGVYLMRGFMKRFSDIGTAVVVVSMDQEYCFNNADTIVKAALE